MKNNFWKALTKNKKQLSITYLIMFLFYPKLAIMVGVIILVNIPFKQIFGILKKHYRTLYQYLKEAENKE